MEAAQKNSGAKPGANKKKLNKGKSKKDKLPLQSGGHKGHPHVKETTFYQGYAAMCAGYFKLVVAMKEEGKIRVPGLSILFALCNQGILILQWFGQMTPWCLFDFRL